ncbi:hypothetical protein FGO68_gene1952 [Halteria grandinella]|uniref:Transmembrane protein n=1 Tax=Halteria grandinella TaxID=5974 RepID=A0A8J8P3E6_HALGN|nr:hypothetical protein FGO68_gene1952 [Halteria grandinella]
MEEISSSLELDTLKIRVLKNVEEDIALGRAYLYNNTVTTAYIPIQYTESQQEIMTLLERYQYAMGVSLLATGVFFQLFFGFAMDLIWGMMNDMTFIMSLSMISIAIPGITSPIQSFIIQFIYMDYLMTDKWLQPMMARTLSVEDEDDDQPLNTFVDEQGFGSKLLIFNLGSAFVFLIMQVFLLIATGVTSFLKTKWRIANTVHQYLRPKLLWGGTIKFIIQQFQPLFISSVINISAHSNSYVGEGSYGYSMSYILSVLIIGVLAFSIFCFNVILKKRKGQLSQFSPLIEGIKEGTFARYLNPIILLKWAILCLTIVILADYPCLQFQVLMSLSIASNSFQIGFLPQTSKVEQAVDIFNEIMATVYLQALVGIAISTEASDRQTLGLFLLCVMLSTLFINFMKVLILIILKIIWKCRHCNKVKVKVEDFSEITRAQKIALAITNAVKKKPKNIKKKKKKQRKLQDAINGSYYNMANQHRRRQSNKSLAQTRDMSPMSPYFYLEQGI